jgi:hypothetical protein
MRRMMAETLLPKMDDPLMWDTPPPECVDGDHDWQIMEDYTFTWRDLYANGATTYDIAMVCPKCTLAMGF